MSYDPTKVEVELRRAAPYAAVSSQFDVIDLSRRLLKDGLGAINRAMERDLLSFRTGDVTFDFDNPDGVMDEVFALMEPTDRWMIRLKYSGIEMFNGIVIGKGSVTYHRKERSCTVSAYGPSKILDLASAESVKRTFSAMSLTANPAPGATSVTMNTTSGLLAGDVIHLTKADQTQSEDVTIRLVASGTQLTLKTGLVADYDIGDVVTVKTPFHRMRSIKDLATLLFAAAGVPVAEYLTTRSGFGAVGPTPMSAAGIPSGLTFVCPGCERQVGSSTRIYATQQSGGVGGTYYLDITRPDGSWTQEDSSIRAWMDWSRYRRQKDGPPTVILRLPDGTDQASRGSAHGTAVDDRGATKILYCVNPSLNRIESNTTTDGLTWTGWVNVAALPISVNGSATGLEYDPKRNGLYLHVYQTATTRHYAYFYDITGASFTLLEQDLTAPFLVPHAFRYIPELDYTIALRGDPRISINTFGTSSELVAYRGTQQIFSRVIPTTTAWVHGGGDPGAVPWNHATHSARYINGRVYMLVYADKEMQLISSDDDFQTYVMKPVASPTTSLLSTYPSRVADAYIMWLFSDTGAGSNKAFQIAAPFYAGVINYADFTGMTVGEALSALALVANCFFWVDDSLSGHFVARDLLPADFEEILPLFLDYEEDLHWEETRGYAQVRGTGTDGVAIDEGAGNLALGNDKFEVNSDFVPNKAFAYSLASNLADFYSVRRAVLRGQVDDVRGRIYRPWDRVYVGGRRFMVYESNHDLIARAVELELVEG